jgi:hypothetical protein
MNGKDLVPCMMVLSQLVQDLVSSTLMKFLLTEFTNNLESGTDGNRQEITERHALVTLNITCWHTRLATSPDTLILLPRRVPESGTLTPPSQLCRFNEVMVRRSPSSRIATRAQTNNDVTGACRLASRFGNSIMPKVGWSGKQGYTTGLILYCLG